MGKGGLTGSGSGFARLIGAAVAGVVLAGCGTTMNASIIGVPPTTHGDALGTTEGAITAFQRALAAQLNQSATGGLSGVDLAFETNALASNATLKTAERLDALRSAGLTTANGLETTLQGLIATTASDSKLSAVSVDGRSVGPTLLALLNGAEVQVQGLAAKIAADTLVDVLRTDNLALSAVRVHGFIDQQAHLLIAGGDTLYEVNSLGQTEQNLSAQISAGSATDPNYGVELSAWNGLRAALETTAATASDAVRGALSLSGGGYPGNQGTMSALHQSLAQLPNGALNSARTIIVQIKTLLAQRHQ